jgi:GNAT superfamily N-acetyltransferase
MYTIRRVDGNKNWHVISELDRQCFTSAYLVPDQITYWWIAYHENKPVAFAGLRKSHRYSDVGYLCRVGVAEAHRGKGLQKRLVKVRCRYAKRIGMTWVRTDTHFNLASSNNLIACGFKLFRPNHPWSFKGSLYWRKEL